MEIGETFAEYKYMMVFSTKYLPKVKGYHQPGQVYDFLFLKLAVNQVFNH